MTWKLQEDVKHCLMTITHRSNKIHQMPKSDSKSLSVSFYISSKQFLLVNQKDPKSYTYFIIYLPPPPNIFHNTWERYRERERLIDLYRTFTPREKKTLFVIFKAIHLLVSYRYKNVMEDMKPFQKNIVCTPHITCIGKIAIRIFTFSDSA